MTHPTLPSDPLVTTLLPVLLHKLSNATQLLSTMNTLLGLEGGEQLALSKTREMAQTSGAVDELGWMLAALASSAGADLLLERRESRGIAIMLEGLREAMRRRGQDLILPDEPLPDLAPQGKSGGRLLGGWEIPWAIAALIVDSAEELERGAALSLRVQVGAAGEPMHFSCSSGKEPGGLAHLVRERLPEAELDFDDQRWSLSLPAGWFQRKSD